MDEKPTAKLLGYLAVVVVTGILVTHLFREVLRRSGWLMLPVEKALPKLLIGILVICVVDSLIRITMVDTLDLLTSKHKMAFIRRHLFATLDNGLYVIPWTLIYYFYHYIEKSRRQQLDTLKLEALVKELELKTIKSHISTLAFYFSTR